MKADAESRPAPVLAEIVQKDALRISGGTWTSSKQGDVYTGSLPHGLGGFCYQYEGNRLMATVDSIEVTKVSTPHLSDLLARDSLKDDTINFLDLLQAMGYDRITHYHRIKLKWLKAGQALGERWSFLGLV